MPVSLAPLPKKKPGRVSPFIFSKPPHLQSSLTRIFATGEPLTKSPLAFRGSEHEPFFCPHALELMPCTLPCGHVCHVATWPCPVAWWAPGAKHGRVQECSGQEATPKPPQSRLRGAAGPYKLLKRLATAAGGVITWLGLGRGLRDRVGVRSHGQGEGWDSAWRAGWSGRRGDHGCVMVIMG